MSRKKKKLRQRLTSCEHQSDKRTAEFIIRRLDDVQEQVYDLLADLRAFEHYGEIEDASWCLNLLQRLKRKYRRFVENGVWED